MHPILFKLGPITVYSWGFMLAIAVLVGIIGVRKLFTKEGYDPEIVLDLAIVMVVSGLLGARLLYIWTYEWDLFLSSPLLVINPGADGIKGLIWYGALLGGFLGFAIYIWRKQLPFWRVADLFAPFAALGYSLVRIGCFMAGCCYGKFCSLPIGVVFPDLGEFARYPTQLFSSLINLLIFIFLLWYLPRRKYPGQVFLIYLILYAMYRFIIEFFRANLVMFGPFSNSQIYSLIILFAAIAFYAWQNSRNRNE
ncbi:MAG: prolipoprotein diacylglyceryl transferase [Syntrophomonadaceae bacterium]|nr:prolipoprotein diacylglyceryl transferase [Syntrophomonadaceae bacterium]MDD3022394.1 prolipoprotein diacylglyceryl transferase [Syntrophomonadaceae bacterium]